MPLAETERLKARTFPSMDQLKSYVELTYHSDATETQQKAVGLPKLMPEQASNQQFEKR